MVNITEILNDVAVSLAGSIVGGIPFFESDELNQYADEASTALAKAAAIHASEDLQSVSLAATYTLIDRFLRMAQVDEGGRMLQITPMTGLDAIDPNWRTTAWIEAERYCIDADGTGILRIYPAPQVPGSILRQVALTLPSEITDLTPTVDLPSAMSDYFFWAVLAKARSKGGKAQATDISEPAERVAGLFTQAATQIWGE